MRWFAAILAVFFVILGALFGIGYFLLPSAMTVERHTIVERPRAAVFALLDNLRTFSEWSPWSGADAGVVYTFEGESGVGQSATWETRGGIGPGTQTIVRSVENQRVESVLDLGQRGAPKMVWAVEKAPAGARVTWSMTSDCSRNPVFVPCRYMNLLSRRQLEADFEGGLSRLKGLAEQLPAVDFEPLKPEFLQAEPVAYAFVENDVTRDAAPEGASPEALAERDATYSARVRRAIDESLAVVDARLKDAGATVSGPPVMVTVSSDEDRLVFRVGYPFQGATPAADPRVAIGQTPEGRALKFVHTGPAEAMRTSYMMIGAYLAAHRLQTNGGPWEIHVQTTGEPAAQRREIYIPIR
ncbi:MAG: SRPBCC family protein [Hyphomonadaceae bacterium]|nr:SRPBCC family protein [Hyphomonadaceae bacterium]